MILLAICLLTSPKMIDSSLGTPMLQASVAPMPPDMVVTNNGGPVTYMFAWHASPFATGYQLGFFTNVTASPLQVTNTAGTNVSFTVNYPPDALYGWWRVRATNAAGASAWSITYPPPPAVTVVISWTPAASTQLQTSSDLLHWTALGSFVSPVTNIIASDFMPHWFRGGKGVKLSISRQ